MGKKKGFLRKVISGIGKVPRETIRIIDQTIGLGNKAIEKSGLDKVLPSGGKLGVSTSSGSHGGSNIHYQPSNSSTSIGFGISNAGNASLFVDNQVAVSLTTPPAHFIEQVSERVIITTESKPATNSDNYTIYEEVQPFNNRLAERDQLLREMHGPGYIPESSLATMGSVALGSAIKQFLQDSSQAANSMAEVYLDTYVNIYSANDTQRAEAWTRNQERAVNAVQSIANALHNPGIIKTHYENKFQDAHDSFVAAHDSSDFIEAGAAAGQALYGVYNISAVATGATVLTAKAISSAAKTANRFITANEFRTPVVFQFQGSRLNSGIPLDELEFRAPIVKKSSLCNDDLVPSSHPDSVNIRLSLLKDRYRLLEENGLLENRARILIGMENGSKGRTVFRNRHLYDPNFVRKDGLTNLEAMKLEGWAPIGYDGKTVNVIHHFEQKHDGAWVVISQTFHRQNTKLLHSTPQPTSGVNHGKYGTQRIQFWKSEAADIIAELNGTINVNTTPGPKL